MPEEVAVQEAPAEVSQDKPADSPPETPPILPEDTGVEQVAEAEVEAVAEPGETPEGPAEEPDEIAALPKEVLSEIYRRRGSEIPEAQEDLRRKEQSTKDSIIAEEAKRQAQEADNQRVIDEGKQAITNINAAWTEAERAMSEAGIADDIIKQHRNRLFGGVSAYNRAWLMGQAGRLNTELQEAFLKVTPVVESLTEEDMGQLTEAVKTSNKQGTRVPTIEATYTLTYQKGFQGGYAAAIHDLVENDKRVKAVEGQKDGLRKLKDAVPTKSPASTGGAGQSRRATLQQKYREGTGTAAEDAEYRRILDADQAKG